MIENNGLFRFETLLKLRKQREDEAKRVVAERLNRIRALEERAEAIQQRITTEVDEVRNELQVYKLNTDQIRLGRHWITRMRQGLLNAEAEMRTQQAILSAERRQLTAASTDRKILAKLKEQRLEKAMAEQRRLEQAEMDELNTLRFVHSGLQSERDRL